MGVFSRSILIIFCFICQEVSPLLFAQTNQFLEGKVFDSATSEPLPFITVRLKDNQLSFYTNAEGDFRLSYNSEFLSDSVILTSIGYKNHSIAFKDLKDKEPNKIYLTPSKAGSYKIKIVDKEGKLNSVNIIRNAINSIGKRYPAKPFSFISYYRDYQKRDSVYLNMNEAILQTIDSGFTSGSISNVFRFLDFKKNPGFPRINFSPVYEFSDSTLPNIPDQLIPDIITHDHYGNEFYIIMAHDPIHNFKTRSFSFIDTISRNFINNHNFSPPSEVFNNTMQLFKINFNGKTGIIGDSLLVSGAIYIQPEDYSIHKLEYSCYRNTKGKGLKNVFKFAEEYEYDNTKDSLMRLKYISLSRLFNVFDSDDKSYFRLCDSGWDLLSNLNPTLILRFNNRIDPVIASRKENYTIMFGKKEVKIYSIQVVGENLFLRFKNDDIKDFTDPCEVYSPVLKDINGNILDQRRSMEVYQHRELFVEKFNKPGTLQDTSAVNNLHSEGSIPSPFSEKNKYWMNTPQFNPKLSPEK